MFAGGGLGLVLAICRAFAVISAKCKGRAHVERHDAGDVRYYHEYIALPRFCDQLVQNGPSFERARAVQCPHGVAQAGDFEALHNLTGHVGGNIA
jgi:hypothetical protein